MRLTMSTTSSVSIDSILSSAASFQQRPTLTIDDIIVLVLFLVGSSSWLFRGTLWDKPDPYHYVWFERPQLKNGFVKQEIQASHSIAERALEQVCPIT